MPLSPCEWSLFQSSCPHSKTLKACSGFAGTTWPMIFLGRPSSSGGSFVSSASQILIPRSPQSLSEMLLKDPEKTCLRTSLEASATLRNTPRSTKLPVIESREKASKTKSPKDRHRCSDTRRLISRLRSGMCTSNVFLSLL